jgi:hypothetical protein
MRAMRYKELVAGWPDYVGVVKASSFGAGGFIVGELSECRPTVFRLRWPPDALTLSYLTKTEEVKLQTQTWKWPASSYCG